MKVASVIILLSILFSASGCGEDNIFDIVRHGLTKDIVIALSEGRDINVTDGSGLTVLDTAARYNIDPDAVKLLVKAGADPNGFNSVHTVQVSKLYSTCIIN